VIGGLTLSLLATTASASLFLILTQNTGTAGMVVRGHTGGNGAFAKQVSPLPTFFVDEAVADTVFTPDDVRLVRVGQLVVDANGNGVITFVVPSLPRVRATGLSVGYCALIRRGLRVPHPRWWAAFLAADG